MNSRTLLQNGEIVLVEGVLHGGDVLIEDSKIACIHHPGAYTPEPDVTVIDCSDRYVCPGFIDLHNQGGGGFSVTNPTEESIFGMARAHAAHGTTGLLLTPPVNGDFRSLLPKLAGLAGHDTGGAEILGIHTEGPFLNPVKRGFMPTDAIMTPDAAILDEIIGLCDDKLVEMTIAPDLDGALDLIHTLAANDIVASLGHSNATLNDVLNAIDFGATHVTHFFNAMSPIDRHEPGLTGAALFSADLTVEVIADGFHIHPWLLGLTLQNKGAMRMCLITDAMPPVGMGDGEYEVFGERVHAENGRLSNAENPAVLAGSMLTMDRAVANMINMVGCTVAEAVFMASAAPAAVIGLDERKGRIETGFDADIAILDRMYRTQMTIVGGKVVYGR